VQHSIKLEIEAYTLNANNNPVKVDMERFDNLDVCMADRRYLRLSDFDDHFENINNDWMNKALFDA
jgi:hypothetical protein